jgi:2-dehydropantoate 2-reductase
VKILVVGAGAVGSLFGARFTAAGHAVTLVGRPDHVATIRERGLTVEGVGAGVFRMDAETGAPRARDPDLVLVTVKSYDLDAAVRAVPGWGIPPVPTVLPQNGLHLEPGAIAGLRASGWADPVPWVVRAVNSVPATWVAPGVVRQPGSGEVVFRDPALPSPSSAATGRARELFGGAGITVRVVADLERELWRKALVNAAVNPVTALGGVPNGRVLDPPYRDRARALLREAQTAARAEGFDFSDAEADADLERIVRASAGNRSSMLQDVDRGRPTEVDAISGELLRSAQAHGIDLPATRAVVERLRALGAAQPS